MSPAAAPEQVDDSGWVRLNGVGGAQGTVAKRNAVSHMPCIPAMRLQDLNAAIGQAHHNARLYATGYLRGGTHSGQQSENFLIGGRKRR